MQRLTIWPRNERGATLAMVALMIFLFLGLGALTIDYGMIKTAKAEAQRAADASALAGASVFLDASLQDDASRTVEAEHRARDYVNQQLIRHVAADSTTPDFEVATDLVDRTVTTTVTKPDIGLWFARVFGVSNMGVVATATAQAQEVGAVNTCLMPVALPDIWNNTPTNDRVIDRDGSKEDRNGDGLWDWQDLNGNGKLDPGEWESWTYDQDLGDGYDQDSGYGTTARNGLGSGGDAKTNDYGRQIVVQPLDSKDRAISGYYQAWGRNSTDANSADSLAAHIRNGLCVQTSLNNFYASNGGSLGGVTPAWDERINREPSADWTWDDATNTPDCGASGCPADWLSESPRVVTVALYDPVELLTPSDNGLKFNNFARIFLDQHCPVGTAPGQCKQPITAHFLGYVSGVGVPGGTTGTLPLQLRLIK